MRLGTASPQGSLVAAREGDHLQFTLTSPGAGVLQVYNVQDDGQVQQYLAPRNVGAKEPVTAAVVLDAYAGSERIYFLQAEQPIQLERVQAALQRSFQVPLAELDDLRRKTFLKEVGEQILWEIHRVTPVTPSAVAATVLLSHHRRGMMVAEFHRRCRFLVDFLTARDACFSNSMMGETRDALDGALRQFADNRLVEIFEEPDANDIIAIVPERRMTMDYYKNNIVNHLAGASMMAVAAGHGRRCRDDVMQRYAELRDLLHLDLRADPHCPVDAEAEAALAELLEVEALREDGDGFVVERTHRAALFRAVLRNLLEAYLVTLRGAAVLQLEPMSDRQLLEWLQKEGRKLYMTEDVTRFEAVSKVTLRNAIRTFRAAGVLVTRPDSGALGVDTEARQRQLQRVNDLMGDL